ncbi:type IV pilus modification PilV family protein [Ferrimonas pelagia]|uniref:Prepilin-type N-terminal cleavage/methylation domain-containing protein n=1 Tax=Ferrimonas pelagia TaxID=1177826 RepID=A0ABP9EAM4_9GAMM
MKRNAAGFGLIEVMVALLIVSAAVVGLSRLQGGLLRSGADTSLREVALKLAQAKVDDLRSYSSSAASGSFDFSDIATNAGGRLADGVNLVFPAETVRYQGHDFVLSWTVSDHYISGGVLMVTPVMGSEPVLKQVAVTVGWLTPHGDAKSVLVNDNIAQILPTPGGWGAISSGAGGVGPSVYSQPGAAPDVLGLEIGSTDDGEGGRLAVERETFKPIPDVERDGELVLVQFDTINFTDDGEVAGEVVRLAQQDALTTGCRCSFDASPEGQFELAAGVYVNSENESEDWLRYLESVTVSASNKVAVGAVSASNQISDRGEELCTLCCRSHFDAKDGAIGTAELAELEISRGEPYSALSFSQFQYYSQDSVRHGGTLRYQLDGDEAEEGDVYLEACRMQRINGFYRMMPDWQQIDLQLLPRTYLNDSRVETAYLDHIQSVLTTYMACDGANDPVNFPNLPGCALVEQAVGADIDGDGVNDTIPKREVTLPPGTHQLMARAIYMDPITEAIQTAYTGGGSQTNLAALPFSEVNITLFADWQLYQCPSDSDVLSADEVLDDCTLCTDAASCEGVTLTSEPVETIVAPDSNYYGTYSRGLLSIGAGLTSDYYAYVKSGQSNSGLTGLGAISPQDEVTARESVMKLNIEGTLEGFGGRVECLKLKNNGNGYQGCHSSDWDDVAIVAVGNVSCELTVSGSAASSSFSCSYSPGAWSGSVEIVNAAASVLDGVITSEQVASAAAGEDGAENQFCILMYESSEAVSAPGSCEF